MKRQRNRINRSALIILSIGAVAHHLYADGYRNPPPTAEGIGKSGVNMIFVDDASAISYNPANLAMQTNRSLVVSATFAQTETTYSNPLVGTIESDGDWNVLPNIYYSQPVGEKGMVVGIGINTPYGQGVSWNASDLTVLVGGPPLSPVVPYEASVMFLNINPTVAFPVHESVYIGVGLDVVYSQLELKALNAVPPPAPPGTIAPSEGEGDGWGVGGNLGITWLPTARQRLALTYRSRVKVDYNGDFETTIKYPDIIGLGYGIQITDHIQLETQLEWLQWSINDTQPFVAGGVSNPQINNWDDTITLGVGGSWAVTEAFVARAGYAFIPSPIPDATITHLLADEDRHALSLGLGYTVGAHTLDLAYTFSIYDDRDSTPSGAYEVDSNLVGVTYSLSF